MINLNSDFFQSTGFRIYLLVGLLAVLLAIAIPVMIHVLKEPVEEPNLYSRNIESEAILLDFQLPYSLIAESSWDWMPSRVISERWTEDQIATYWINPRDIFNKILEEEIEVHIDEIFQNIP